MTDEEILNRAINDGIKLSRSTLSKHYGITDYRARKIVILSQHIPISTKDVKQQPIRQKGITMEELRAKYDIFFIVKKTVDTLEEDVFYQNSDFVLRCNFPGNSGYRETLERSEFADYRGKAGGTIYWGHPNSIKKLKEEGVLR